MTAKGSLFRLNSTLRRAAWVMLVALVLSGAGLAIATQWARASSVDWAIRPGWLVLAALAYLAFQSVHAELWRAILRSLGESVPPARGHAIFAVSLLVRYVPTGLLMPAVRVALAGREGVVPRVAIVSVVYELTIEVSAAVAVGAYLLLKLPALDHPWLPFAVAALPVAGVVFLHPALVGRLASFAGRRFTSVEVLPVSLRFPRVMLFFALYAASFLLAGLCVLLLQKALYAGASSNSLVPLTSFAVAFVVSAVAFMLPAGLGAREAVLTGVLTLALPPPVALAIAVMTRVLQIVVEILAAAALSLCAFRRPRWSRAQPLNG